MTPMEAFDDDADDFEGGKEDMSSAPEAPTSSPARPESSTRPATAITYLRVSTKEQAEMGGLAEGYSIPAQRIAVQRKAESMGASVVAEFTDAGESARSADRPELKRMLAFVASEKVDYVIVHKIDRLARNRLDDLMISVALEEAGVQLVSCTEHIDASPAGKLTHGLMALIAEWYSSNLSQEVKTKTMEKVRRGGTVGKAPIGYLNVRKVIEGREVRTVEVDPERGDPVSWAFDAYSTGDWSLSALTQVLQEEGLTTVPSPHYTQKPVPRSTVYRILRNPYYTGVILRQGVTYPGLHEPLVSPTVFQKVQEVLETHNLAGEKQRVHEHYLKGSVFCGTCGSRLCITKAKNRHGSEYLYFFCLGNYRRLTVCNQGAIPVELVEAHIEDKWANIQLNADYAETIRDLIEEEMAKRHETAERSKAKSLRRLALLSEQQEKLLQAHYAGAVPLDLMKKEQDRIATELMAVEEQIRRADLKFEAIETSLEMCLGFLTNCHEAYSRAEALTRRKMNQAVFSRFLVSDDGVEEAELDGVFGILLRPDLLAERGRIEVGEDAVHRRRDWADGVPRRYGVPLGSANGHTERSPSQSRERPRRVWGLNKHYLAEEVGFEPTVPSRHNGFRDRPIRPLSHSSVEQISACNRCLSALSEEGGEDFGALFGPHTCGDRHFVVEARIGAEVVKRSTRAGPWVSCSEHELSDTGRYQGSGTHGARFEGDHQGD